MTEILENLALEHEQKIGNISIIFCSDEYLLDMNKQHLGHDFFTDVITFDYCSDDLVSGDIFISIDRIKENAKTFKVKLEFEIVRVVGHGFLHLLGYKDKKAGDAKKMVKMEDLVLEKWQKKK
jgi:rRNA maturation RNase YbeY